MRIFWAVLFSLHFGTLVFGLDPDNFARSDRGSLELVHRIPANAIFTSVRGRMGFLCAYRPKKSSLLRYLPLPRRKFILFFEYEREDGSPGFIELTENLDPLFSFLDEGIFLRDPLRNYQKNEINLVELRLFPLPVQIKRNGDWKISRRGVWEITQVTITFSRPNWDQRLARFVEIEEEKVYYLYERTLHVLHENFLKTRSLEERVYFFHFDSKNVVRVIPLGQKMGTVYFILENAWVSGGDLGNRVSINSAPLANLEIRLASESNGLHYMAEFPKGNTEIEFVKSVELPNTSNIDEAVSALRQEIGLPPFIPSRRQKCLRFFQAFS